MMFLIQNGYTDLGALTFLQNTAKDFVLLTYTALFVTPKIAYVPDKDTFVYTYDLIDKVM